MATTKKVADPTAAVKEKDYKYTQEISQMVNFDLELNNRYFLIPLDVRFWRSTRSYA